MISYLKKSDKIYQLDLVKNKEFQFTLEENSIVRSLHIKSLRLLVNGVKITIETDKENLNVKSIYEAIEMLFNTKWYNFNNALILGATIKAELEADNKKGFKTKVFTIGYPNSCSLKHDEEDLILRKILIDSGLEIENEKSETEKSVA